MASDAQPVSAKQPVTLREVAALAGVTVATASKALNGQGRMTAETRERIRETISASASWHRDHCFKQ